MLKKILNRFRGESDIEKLKKRGLKVGSNFKMIGQNIIDPSHCWHIEIGNDVVMAPRAHILAHDASTGLFLNYTKVGNVKIGNNVFIGAGAIILMNVTVGDNVIIGAGSVVTRSIPSNSVAAGNPAKVICTLNKYLDKEKVEMRSENTFEDEYTLRNPDFGDQQRKTMIDAANNFKKIYVK